MFSSFSSYHLSTTERIVPKTRHPPRQLLARPLYYVLYDRLTIELFSEKTSASCCRAVNRRDIALLSEIVQVNERFGRFSGISENNFKILSFYTMFMTFQLFPWTRKYSRNLCFTLILARLKQWHAEFKARTVLTRCFSNVYRITRSSKIDNYNRIYWLFPTIALDSLDTNMELTFRLYRLKKCHLYFVQKFITALHTQQLLELPM